LATTPWGGSGSSAGSLPSDDAALDGGIDVDAAEEAEDDDACEDGALPRGTSGEPAGFCCGGTCPRARGDGAPTARLGCDGGRGWSSPAALAAAGVDDSGSG
jgi:hypothetical protein